MHGGWTSPLFLIVYSLIRNYLYLHVFFLVLVEVTNILTVRVSCTGKEGYVQVVNLVFAISKIN